MNTLADPSLADQLGNITWPQAIVLVAAIAGGIYLITWFWNKLL